MSKKKVIVISSIAVGALLIGLFAALIGVNETDKANKEALYQKGLKHLIDGEYKESTEVFADKLLKGYKDTSKKYSYAFNLQKYEQRYYGYEQLIGFGLEEKDSLAVVDFLTLGGSEVPRKIINEKQEGTYINEISAKENYDFLGWNLNYAAYEKETDAIRYILESIYNNHYFNIAYDYDGGEPVSLAPKTYQYGKGSVEIPNAEKKGYDFNGYESPIYDSPRRNFVIPNGTAEDLLLTAKYTAKVIHVTLDSSPAGAVTPSELDVVYGSDVSAIFPKPNRYYYDFLGWYYKDQLVNLEKFEIDHDVTLTAKYSPKTFNVIYVLNNGTPASELPTSYTPESDITLPYIEKENALFIGWSDDVISNKKIDYQLPPINIGERTITANFVNATIVNNKLVDISDHSIKEFVIPSYITDIDGLMLSNLANLEKIYVDNRNTHFSVIDNLLVEDGHILINAPKAYINTHSIVTLSSNIDEIGAYAFRNSNISQISGTHLLNKINEGAFYGCDNLTLCNLNNVSYVGNQAFVSTEIGNAFLNNNKYSLNYIGDEAFSNTNITKLDISNSVIHIGDRAFANCLSLEEVIFHPNFNSELGTSIFEGCSSLIKVETDLSFISDLVNDSLSDAPVSNYKITGSGTIVDDAFLNNTLIENIDLSDASIVRIKKHAFEGCKNITAIDLSNQPNLFLIEPYAFKETGLTSLDLSHNPHLRIDDDAFEGCVDLTTIKMLHGQITTRMGDVFSLCGNIKNVEYLIEETDDDINVPGFMFANLNNVESITIRYLGEGNKVINLGNGAFKGDSRLVDIVLDNCSVNSLPSYCFEGCTAFKNTSGAFSNLESYGEGAFFSCTQLDNMTFTNTVNIGRVAFAGCYSLCNDEPLTIPSTVESIGEEAFSDILGNIYIDLTKEQVAERTVPGGPWNRFDAGFAGTITYKS